MRPHITKIGHVGIGVRDLERSVRFYTDVLGFQLTEEFEYPNEENVGHGGLVTAGAFVRCNPTHHCLSIFTYRSELVDENAVGPHYGLHHIAFELASAAELLGLFRDFRERGLDIVSARKGGPGNQPRFYARDPDGNLLEFYWDIDEIGWDGVAREYAPISEIDLVEFDFEAHLEARGAQAERVREAVGGTQEPA
jgi:catechol 2,3-dioxygenase-like lactoylglutathione lyase family enzyme